jgi:hypothetical protein
MAEKIRFLTQYYPGYGGPETWEIRVIYKNKLLEHIGPLYSDYGVQDYRLRAKWKHVLKPELEKLADVAPLASPVCNVCGKDTLDGQISCVNQIFCRACDKAGKIEKAKTAFNQKTEESRKHFEEKKIEQKQCAIAKTRAALGGAFHWTDGWYFKRQPDGSVRIMRPSMSSVSAMEYLQIDIVIPPNEWASIICSVSAEGENGDRWNAAQDFHGRNSGP